MAPSPSGRRDVLKSAMQTTLEIGAQQGCQDIDLAKQAVIKIMEIKAPSSLADLAADRAKKTPRTFRSSGLGWQVKPLPWEDTGRGYRAIRSPLRS